MNRYIIKWCPHSNTELDSLDEPPKIVSAIVYSLWLHWTEIQLGWGRAMCLRATSPPDSYELLDQFIMTGTWWMCDMFDAHTFHESIQVSAMNGDPARKLQNMYHIRQMSESCHYSILDRHVGIYIIMWMKPSNMKYIEQYYPRLRILSLCSKVS